jgi:hypothetical protein
MPLLQSMPVTVNLFWSIASAFVLDGSYAHACDLLHPTPFRDRHLISLFLRGISGCVVYSVLSDTPPVLVPAFLQWVTAIAFCRSPVLYSWYSPAMSSTQYFRHVTCFGLPRCYVSRFVSLAMLAYHSCDRFNIHALDTFFV